MALGPDLSDPARVRAGRYALVSLGLSGLLGPPARADAAEPPDPPPPAGAHAEPEPPSAEIDPLLARAQALLAQERYDEARALLDEAYRLDPRPSLLWARAQAARWAGDCLAAIELYDHYIATGPTPADRHRARANAERCRAILAESGVVVQADEPEPAPDTTPAPEPEPPPPTADDRPPRDVVGMTSVITGATAFALGGGLIGLGAWMSARADQAPTEEEFGRRLLVMRVELGLGSTLAGVGLGLAIWGTVRLVQRRRTRSSTARSGARWSGLAFGHAQQGAAGSNWSP